MSLRPLICFAAAATWSFGLFGCGDGPPTKHATDDNGAAPVVRGAPLDGSDDPVPAPARIEPAVVSNGGGVPTLPPDEPDSAGERNPTTPAAESVATGDLNFVGPTLSPAGPTAAVPSAARKNALPDGPLGKPDSERPDYLRLVFNDLASFEYDPFEVGVPSLGSSEPTKPAEPTERNSQIPASVLALNGKRVAVAGFMVPIEIRKDQAKSFLLVRNQMLCCFGVQIGFNEWIFVDMEGQRRATFVPDVLVSVYGTLDVGEDVQDGMVMSIFRMKADEVVHEGGK